MICSLNFLVFLRFSKKQGSLFPPADCLNYKNSLIPLGQKGKNFVCRTGMSQQQWAEFMFSFEQTS